MMAETHVADVPLPSPSESATTAESPGTMSLSDLADPVPELSESPVPRASPAPEQEPRKGSPMPPTPAEAGGAASPPPVAGKEEEAPTEAKDPIDEIVDGVRGMKIFVGNLPYDSEAGSLKRYFSRFGEVAEVILPLDHATQRHRGFGFVAMPNRAEATRAIAGTHDKSFEGRLLRVNEAQTKQKPKAVDKMKLFVGNLNFATKEEELRAYFNQFGTVLEVFLPLEHETGRPRGFGFVTFETRAEGETAVQYAHESEFQGRHLRVNEARPRVPFFGPNPNDPSGAAAAAAAAYAGMDGSSVYGAGPGSYMMGPYGQSGYMPSSYGASPYMSQAGMPYPYGTYGAGMYGAAAAAAAGAYAEGHGPGAAGVGAMGVGAVGQPQGSPSPRAATSATRLTPDGTGANPNAAARAVPGSAGAAAAGVVSPGSPSYLMANGTMMETGLPPSMGLPLPQSMQMGQVTMASMRVAAQGADGRAPAGYALPDMHGAAALGLAQGHQATMAAMRPGHLPSSLLQQPNLQATQTSSMDPALYSAAPTTATHPIYR